MLLTQILIILSLLLCILYLKPITTVLPSVFACFLRWKECLNLENSVKLSRDRNIFAAILVLPFTLAVYAEGIIEPEFSKNWSEAAKLVLLLGYFLGYQGLRALMQFFLHPKKISDLHYRFTFRMFLSFFIAAALVLFLIQGILGLVGTEIAFRDILIVSVLGLAHIFFIIRKVQIFVKHCSFLMSILYLCALEILPAGILVSAALFL